MVARPDNDGIGRQPGGLPQAGRQDHSALAVGLDLVGAGEEGPAEGARVRVADRQAADLVGQLIPLRAREDGQAGIEPAGHVCAALELDAELRGDRDSSLVVHRVPVLAGEHRSGFPVVCAAKAGPVSRATIPIDGIVPHLTPLCATSAYYSARQASVNAGFDTKGDAAAVLSAR